MCERKDPDIRDGQLGLGAGLATDLALFDTSDVLHPPANNPAAKKIAELETKLLAGDVPQERSEVDALVYDL